MQISAIRNYSLCNNLKTRMAYGFQKHNVTLPKALVMDTVSFCAKEKAPTRTEYCLPNGSGLNENQVNFDEDGFFTSDGTIYKKEFLDKKLVKQTEYRDKDSKTVTDYKEGKETKRTYFRAYHDGKKPRFVTYEDEKWRITSNSTEDDSQHVLAQERGNVLQVTSHFNKPGNNKSVAECEYYLGHDTILRIEKDENNTYERDFSDPKQMKTLLQALENLKKQAQGCEVEEIKNNPLNDNLDGFIEYLKTQVGEQ